VYGVGSKIRQVLATGAAELAQLGFIISSRGKGGGIKLAKA